MRLVLMIALLAACRGDDATLEDTGETGVVEGCRAGPGPDERVIVVAQPYAADPTTWTVLSLSESGEIAETGQSVQLGRATDGVVAFTPDGSLGLAVLENGDLGVLEVADGVVTVVSSGAYGDRYIGGVTMHPSGEKALLLDPNWRENGGMVVEVAIDCESGALTETGSWPSKLAYAAAAWGESWVVAADDLGGAAGPDDVHLLEEDGFGSAALFPDEEAIISSMAVADDLVILADFNAFAGGNRLGIGRLSADGIAPVSVVPDVEDPVSVVVAPDGTAALVSSGFGDALLALAIDGGASQPVQLLGELPYEGNRPALPGGIAPVPGLSLAIVAENVGVRPVRFRPGGEIVDLGAFNLGAGTEVVVGGIGVQP